MNIRLTASQYRQTLAQANAGAQSGTTVPPAGLRPVAGTKQKEVKQDEAKLQTAVMTWWNYQYPEFAGLLFAVPNGGRRDAREGARFKAQGVTAGVADLILLVPRPHILLLELKVRGGKVSDAQKSWLAKAAAQGHAIVIAYDFHAARAAIVNHIGY